MNNTFLIPANSKKSMLYFGVFNTTDLILFSSGLGLSLLLLVILPIDTLLYALIAIAPGSICGFLVMPVPNYHNIRTIIMVAWEFYTTRQRYIWKGWCIRDGKDSKE